jgi:hypothetical protein
MRRELAIVLRARITWLAAALTAVLVGHGFVLAVDIYSSGSRSVAANALLAEQFDPLAGIVRPTLGGLYLAVSLLAPLVAARGLAIEKERRTFAPLLLQVGAPSRIVAAKALAALAGVGLQLATPLLLLIVWRVVGGHLAFAETAVAVLAHALYLSLVVGLAVAAAAWTTTLAQAAVVAILLVAASWAIDASEGFAALAWLGRAVDWSVTTHLYPMERGTLAVGAALWFVVFTAGALLIAYVGTRSDLRPPRRALVIAGAVAVTVLAGALAHRVRRVLDMTEQRRASLSPAAERALRELPPIHLEVWLDRDDARRQQLEADALAKLRIARGDLDVRMPLDGRAAPLEGERDEGYGRIVIDVGGGRRETRTSSPEELVRAIFEAADRTVPDLSQREYPGYPLVVEGPRRTTLLVVAYLVLPSLFVVIGWLVTRSKRRTP